MPTVATVRGPVAIDALGQTLMHEHIFVVDPEVERNYRTPWDEDAAVDDAVARLEQARARGVTTLVDLTVLGLGRDVRRVARVAQRTGVNIIVATGLYTYDRLPHYFDLRIAATEPSGEDPLVGFFVSDIVDGIKGTQVRAGILKCATDMPGVTPGVERALRAVAVAQRRTGVPISTHTHAGSRRGLDQQRIFAEEGVDLSRVVIGHCGDTTDLGYLEELISRGSYVGMDRFGLDVLASFDDRVATVAQLCARGYADRVVLSHDAACYIDWFDPGLRARSMPRWHFTHIHDDVLPALRACGVAEDQIHQMLVANPAAIFSRQG
ncbi:MAG: phosphotriesterase-related protein [Actinomycetota bacterium]|nr:phosphotriesterase-related protein [Actinomycetota bacterium]